MMWAPERQERLRKRVGRAAEGCLLGAQLGKVVEAEGPDDGGGHRVCAGAVHIACHWLDGTGCVKGAESRLVDGKGDLAEVIASGHVGVSRGGFRHGKDAGDDWRDAVGCDGGCGVGEVSGWAGVGALQADALFHDRADVEGDV